MQREIDEVALVSSDTFGSAREWQRVHAGAKDGTAVNILAIETSTEACSVALLTRDGIIERHEIAPRRHTGLVLPWADELLAQAGIKKSQLDAIAVGRGPGAFTGVRLAIALVQGMAMALEKPVLPVSTLAALAMQASGNETILAAIDARMGEIYLGCFQRDDDGLVSPICAETLVSPDAPALPGAACWQGVGTGFAASQSALQTAMAGRLVRCDANALPHAGDIARLAARAWQRGEAMAPDHLEPAYLRDKVALTISEQDSKRHAQAGGLNGH